MRFDFMQFSSQFLILLLTNQSVNFYTYLSIQYYFKTAKNTRIKKNNFHIINFFELFCSSDNIHVRKLNFYLLM